MKIIIRLLHLEIKKVQLRPKEAQKIVYYVFKCTCILQPNDTSPDRANRNLSIRLYYLLLYDV